MKEEFKVSFGFHVCLSGEIELSPEYSSKFSSLPGLHKYAKSTGASTVKLGNAAIGEKFTANSAKAPFARKNHLNHNVNYEFIT